MLVLGAVLVKTHPVLACLGGGEAAGAAGVTAVGLTAITVYDAIKIASDERPSELMAYSQAVIATPIAFTLGYEVADEEEIDALWIFLEGWFAAVGGFAIGSLAVDRTRSGGVGAAMGLSAASVEHATLTLLGRRPTQGGFIVQTLFAAPGIPAGINWAADARMTADVAGGMALAGIASISLLHGLASQMAGRSEMPTSVHVRRPPHLALACSRNRVRTCTVTASGTW
jgi:hypothetical protein